LCLWITFLSIGLQATPIVFSSGLNLPENITVAPAGFGSFGGSYFIPDPGTSLAGPNVIRVVPAGGGAPTVFATLDTSVPVQNGIFLPSSYGAFGGQYLIGTTFQGSATGAVLDAISSSGTVTLIGNEPNLAFGVPVIAPAGFGSVAGEVLLPDHGIVRSGGNSVNFLTTSGTVGTFVNTPGFTPFGAAFAPAGFGSVGGDLLISDQGSGNIDAVTANGTIIPFATLPLGFGQFGLRQIAFAPAGFGAYGGDLFVSISGSPFNTPGGGAFGSVVVVNPDGQLIATLY
jgi:hypothetical protein